MLVVRGTKKLRDRVKGPLAGDDDASTGVLGDWFANALFWRPQVALLVNARTFVPVFTELAPAATLLDRAPAAIEEVLRHLGADEAFLAAEREAMGEARIAPTNDRSVVGVMTEFAFLAEHHQAVAPAGSLLELSVRLASTVVGPLDRGHGSPDRALAALVGGDRSDDDHGVGRSGRATAIRAARGAVGDVAEATDRGGDERAPGSGVEDLPARTSEDEVDDAHGGVRDGALAEVIPFRPRGRDDSAGVAPPSEDEDGLRDLPVAVDGPDAGPLTAPPRGDVYRLKVTLRETKPPIWRRVLVDGATTLDQLHEVIQAAFGWWNSHLHEFEVGGDRFGVPDPDEGWGPPTIDERSVRLDQVAGEGDRFSYTYDFGDDWRHGIVVEEVRPGDGTMVPACVGGRRACPPEDCGGPWGYQELLEVRDDPKTEWDRDRVRWLEEMAPSFDPEAFDPADFDQNLRLVRAMGFDDEE